MRSPARVAPTPLFDRLVSGDDVTAGVSAALDVDGLKASVARELTRLLVSRHRRPRPDVGRDRTVVEYGVGDHYVLDPRRKADHDLLIEELETVITTFEPRLRNVSIEVIEAGTLDTAARFKISAELAQVELAEPLTFQVTQRSQFLEVR